MPGQPNLLVIMSDQHSPHILGCGGDRLVRTPHLDTLAARGVRFRRAYCAAPLCVPARMTFLTSRHCSDLQVWSNSCILSHGVPTFAHALATAGYETVLCGRMHVQGADQHGFDRRLVGDVSSQWPGTRGPDLGSIPPSTTGQTRPSVEIAGPGRTVYQAFDRAVTDAAVAFLRQAADRAAGARPFCLVVGYVLPHCPFICPKALFDEYHPRVTVPRMREPREALHPALRLWREQRGVDAIPDEVVRTARAAYYGLVTMTDAFVGEVLAALRQGGLERDTAVFYASDHGEMAGEHEMWWKSSFYEGSVGVPLLAAWPGVFDAGAVVDTPVSLLDLAPTLIGLGGAAPLPHARGQDLTALLKGGVTPSGWNEDIFAELKYAPGPDNPAARMIVRGRWKLVHYHGYDAPQLFDLGADPEEVRDLGRDPACASIRDDLQARVLEGWCGDRVDAVVARNHEYSRALRAWAVKVRPPDPDHWVAPTGCNVFPEVTST